MVDEDLIAKACIIVEQSQIMKPVKRRVIDLLQSNFEDRVSIVMELRTILIDLVISLQEVALLDSKNSNSGSSGNSNDELGTLVELVTG
jgi:hypothetical protein